MRLMIWYWGRRGGGAQFALGLAQALANRKDIDLTLSISAQGDLLPYFEDLKVQTQVVNTFKDRLSFATSCLRVPQVVDEFVRVAKGADVVVSAMTHLWTPFACNALRKKAVPYVPVIHDMEPHPGDLALAWDWRLNRELHSARAAVALSATVQHALLSRKPELPVLRMPFPAFLHKPSTVQINRPKTNEIRFLFFGRIRAYKGLDILRDAFSIVANKGLPVRLKVVGEGDFQGFAAGLESVPGVVIENRWVPDTEISTLLSEADVVVLPYSEASQSGIVPQALAMGIPVIGTPVGGLIEQIREGEGGVLASEPNARAFAIAMEYVCSGDVLAELREQARSASGYASDWDAAAREDFSFGRSLNYGCKAATGDALVIVSGHCIPTGRNWIPDLIAQLGINGMVYVYGGQLGDETSHFSERQIFSKFFPAEDHLPQRGFYCNNANSALLKSVWQKYRFDEELTGLEDMHLAKRLVADGMRLGYVARASVYHLHNETWGQIGRRFEREAIALQFIMPEVHLTYLDVFRYFYRAVAHDLLSAVNQKCLLANALSIFRYRYHQFSGSYRGNHMHRKLSHASKELYFYPNCKAQQHADPSIAPKQTQ